MRGQARLRFCFNDAKEHLFSLLHGQLHLRGGDEVEVDGVMVPFLHGAFNKEVLLAQVLDHHGVGWLIYVGVVLVEQRLAKHNIQTFHGKSIERIMKNEGVNGHACIVQNVCACEGSSVGTADVKEKRMSA